MHGPQVDRPACHWNERNLQIRHGVPFHGKCHSPIENLRHSESFSRKALPAGGDCYIRGRGSQQCIDSIRQRRLQGVRSCVHLCEIGLGVARCVQHDCKSMRILRPRSLAAERPPIRQDRRRGDGVERLKSQQQVGLGLLAGREPDARCSGELPRLGIEEAGIAAADDLGSSRHRGCRRFALQRGLG